MVVSDVMWEWAVYVVYVAGCAFEVTIATAAIKIRFVDDAWCSV